MIKVLDVGKSEKSLEDLNRVVNLIWLQFGKQTPGIRKIKYVSWKRASVNYSEIIMSYFKIIVFSIISLTYAT